MKSALDDLIDLLDLEPIEVNVFRGKSPDENRQRVFGGQVAGQALVAAGCASDRGQYAFAPPLAPPAEQPRMVYIGDVRASRGLKAMLTALESARPSPPRINDDRAPCSDD